MFKCKDRKAICQYLNDICADFQSLSSPNSSSSSSSTTTTPTATTTTTSSTNPSQISRCITSCAGLESGDYQSCHGCNVYASCWGGGLTDDRPCPASLVWDDIKKRCEYSSPTWWVALIKMSIVLHPFIYYPLWEWISSDIQSTMFCH